jgi:hypothetical protein
VGDDAWLADFGAGCLMFHHDRAVLEAMLAIAEEYVAPGSLPTKIVIVEVDGFAWFTALVGNCPCAVHGPHDDALESG